jgi:predicted N-acyltransferase
MHYEILDTVPTWHYETHASWLGWNIYHSEAWHRFLQGTFGWRIRALVGYQDNQPVVSLPIIIKRRLSKRVAVALPFSHHICMIHHPSFQAESHTPQKPQGTTSLEVHGQVTWQDAHHYSNYVVTKLPLHRFEDEDQLFASMHKSSIQRKIKKASKNGFTLATELTDENLQAFADMQNITRQHQGSPTYPSKFFMQMRDALGDKMRLYLAVYDEKPVAGVVFLHDTLASPSTAIYGYGASLPEDQTRQLGANQWVMWQAILQAYHEDFDVVDFGITPNHHESLRAYKEKWGATSTPLYHTMLGEYQPINRDSASVKWVSRFLQSLPYPLFVHLSPILLREVV